MAHNCIIYIGEFCFSSESKKTSWAIRAVSGSKPSSVGMKLKQKDHLYYNSEVCVYVCVCLCTFYLKAVNGNDLILFAS